MLRTYKFPEDVDVEGRNFLDITAFNYRLPNIASRDALGVPVSVPPSSSNTPSDSLAEAGAVADQLEASGASELSSDAVLGEERWKVLTYIPAGFGDSISPQWGDESIAMVGSASDVKVDLAELTGLFQGGATPGQVFKTLGSLTGVVTGALSHIVTSYLRSKIEGSAALSTIRNTAEAFAGTRVSVNKSKIYMGSQGISLNLQLQMAPKNQNEGINMLRIVENFRDASIPSLASASVGNVQFFKYPPIFRIIVRRGGTGPSQPVRTGTFFEYRAMVLTNFQVSYSSGGQVYSHFQDDIPTKTDLTLAFASLFPVFKTDQGTVDETQRLLDLAKDAADSTATGDSGGGAASRGGTL